MRKTIIFFLATFFLTSMNVAADYSVDNEKIEASSSEITQGDNVQSTDPRWHKSRSGRQDYLQGGRGSRHMQQQPVNAGNDDRSNN